jgi:hypothetical protein
MLRVRIRDDVDDDDDDEEEEGLIGRLFCALSASSLSKHTLRCFSQGLDLR